MDEIRLFIGRYCQEKKDGNITPAICPYATIRTEFTGRGMASKVIRDSIIQLRNDGEIIQRDTIHGFAYELSL